MSKLLHLATSNEHILFFILSNSSLTLSDLSHFQCCKFLRNLINSEAAVFLWKIRHNNIACSECKMRNKQAYLDFVGEYSSEIEYWKGCVYRDFAAKRLRAQWNLQFSFRFLDKIILIVFFLILF